MAARTVAVAEDSVTLADEGFFNDRPIGEIGSGTVTSDSTGTSTTPELVYTSDTIHIEDARTIVLHAEGTLRATAESDMQMRIYDNGVLVVRVNDSVSGSGLDRHFSFNSPPTYAPDAGDHTFTVYQGSAGVSGATVNLKADADSPLIFTCTDQGARYS